MPRDCLGGSALRGLRQRAGVSAGILLVATVAAAAATTGPAYDAAARTSVMRDAMATPDVIDRAVEATSSGPVSGLATSLAALAGQALANHLGGQPRLARLFSAPVQDTLIQVPATRVVNPGALSPATSSPSPGTLASARTCGSRSAAAPRRPNRS